LGFLSTGDPEITARDFFQGGLEKATRKDIEKVHAQISQWLDYWTKKEPDSSLASAIDKLRDRLILAKRGWRAERGDEQFPIEQAMSGVRGPVFEADVFTRVETFGSAWIDLDRDHQLITLKWSYVKVAADLGATHDSEPLVEFFKMSDEPRAPTDTDVMVWVIMELKHWFDDYSVSHPSNRINQGIEAFIAARRNKTV
jgi:hypothetical protein